MLDEEYKECLHISRQSQNAYIFGRIRNHRIVTTLIPQCGNTTAAAVATQLRNDFPRVKVCFLVGIGGGVLSERTDIRLGDVVVSIPEGDSSGVVQYDLGRTFPNGRFERIGTLNKPPVILTGYSALLRSQGERQLGE